MPYVVGIDAGATKTVALLANENGEILSSVRGPGANLVLHGEASVESTLRTVIGDLDSPDSVSAICIGIAGADRPGEATTVRGILERIDTSPTVHVVNDAHVALLAGAPSGSGIVVVAGTGSIAYGVANSGQRARSGGWGYLLGDEGSAFWLGHAALRVGLRALDGRGPESTLYDRIQAHLGLKDSAAVVSWFYHQERARIRVARLAAIVEEASVDGDQTATRLLDQAAHHLASAAASVDRQLGFDSRYRLVLAGGAFEACPSLIERYSSEIDPERIEVYRLAGEPALGAVLLALQQLSPE